MKQYFYKHKLEFLWVGILSVLSSAVFVGISLILQYVIDRAIDGKVAEAVITSIGFIIVFGLIYWLAASSQVRLNTKVMKALREDIVTKILRKSTVEFQEHEEADYISLVQSDVKRVEDSYLDTFYSCIKASTQLIFAIAVMTYYSPVFTVTMLGMTAAMFIIPGIFSKKLEKATGEVSSAQEGLTRGMSEVVYGFEVTKSFQKEKHRLQKFDACNLLLRQTTKKLEMLKVLNGGISNVLAFSMQMVICILAGYFIYKGQLSYGSMVGVIQVSGSITNPLFQLFAWIPALKAFKPIWEKIGNFTKDDFDSTIAEVPVAWNKISLSDVRFTYGEETGKDVLNGVNLTIEKGKKYLIVGESGSGKTTLVNILAGKMKPTGGSVLLDGKETQETKEQLQLLASGVWQNVFLFNDSIEENILLGDEDKKDLQDVINATALKDVIADKGLDFVVGTNGDQLSGGQKQRIAIARALHADKDIIIMDEGLSALDEDMGKGIEKAMLATKGLTVISISHHASEEMRALYDEIIEIKNGKVA